MIRRTLMRRAYNSGRWERARHYANQIISKPKEQQLARSVIIRSYWNEGNYRKVRELNKRWNNEFDHLLNRNSKTSMTAEDGTQTHSPQVKAWHEEQPVPLNSFEFDEDNPMQLIKHFDADGDSISDKLICDYWARWGAAVCDVDSSAFGYQDLSLGCHRVGVLSSRSEGLSDLVCNHFSVLKFDGEKYGVVE